MKTITLAACILGFASAAATAEPLIIEAHQLPAQEFLTERVSFADLDISRQAGLGTLKSRIHAAATRVCESTNPERLMATVEFSGCYRRAIDNSYAQIDKFLAATSA